MESDEYINSTCSIEKVQRLVDMGFHEDQIESALIESNQDEIKAYEILIAMHDRSTSHLNHEKEFDNRHVIDDTLADRLLDLESLDSHSLSMSYNSVLSSTIKDMMDLADDEFPITTSHVEERLTEWKHERVNNLRALLLSINARIWPNINWPTIHLLQLDTPEHVKDVYMKVISKVHPDKWQHASDKERMLANGIFCILNEAWKVFKQQEMKRH